MSGNEMRVGLLWFDDEAKREVSLKIQEAAERYFEKSGRRPDLCYVNPTTLPLSQDVNHGLRLLSSPLILPDHFWVGESHQPKEKAPRSED